MELKRSQVFLTALVLLVSIWLLPTSAVAQADLSVAILSVDDSGFPQVTAAVAVDYRGRPLPNIAPVDIDVQESGAGAALLSIRRAADENVPLALVLAIDVSGSMEGEPLEKAKASAVSLLSGLESNDVAAVVAFGEVVRIEQGLTSDRAALIASVSRLRAEGSTPLYDAVAESAQIAASSGLVRRAVVLLSDGKESGEGQRRSREDSLRLASEARAFFYVVGVGTDVDRGYLDELATRSRGRFFEAFGSAEIPSIYAALDELLRAHLVLTFRAMSARDLQDRSVKVTVSQDGISSDAQLAYRSLRAAPVAGGPPLIILIPAVAGAVALLTTIAMGRRKQHPLPNRPEEGEPVRARGVRSVSPRRARLTVVVGPTGDGPRDILVGERPVTIGSDAACALHLNHSADVGSKHARVWLRNGRMMLHHLARTKETIVGGQSISWAALDEGEEMTIGPYVLRYVGEAAHSADEMALEAAAG